MTLNYRTGAFAPVLFACYASYHTNRLALGVY